MLRLLPYLVLLGCVGLSGCTFVPQVAHQPSIRNPFPQLSKVAVAPFFNLSDEPTLDGRRVATAYYNELQAIPGFEVVPVGVVERAIQDYGLTLRSPEDARRLAQILDVDAVVIGAVTEYSPYYPPRVGLQIEWYAANSCFHPIPPGYGLPWGTEDEQDIPEPLVFEAEMALAKAQLATQTPPGALEQIPAPLPVPVPGSPGASQTGPRSGDPGQTILPGGQGYEPEGPGSEPGSSVAPLPPEGSGQGANETESDPDGQIEPTSYQGPDATGGQVKPTSHQEPATDEAQGAVAGAVWTGVAGGFPPDWPDPRGFIPPGPQPVRPPCWPSREPVLRHTRIYHGNDMDFAQALETYVFFRDDARFGGWQGYLQRSEDFIRFCCHMHIAEMLTARGGAGQSRVVWRWDSIR